MIRFQRILPCNFASILILLILALSQSGFAQSSGNDFNSATILPDWATYYGGSGEDIAKGKGIATDVEGNIFIAGGTKSKNGSNIIATEDAFQKELNGERDMFVAKFSPDGTRLWGTYFGGEKWDFARDLEVDAAGNVYATGFTGSTSGVATSGAHQTSHGGGDDAFIAKFSPEGQLLWATYFGGNENEHIHAIEAYGDRIYTCGRTASSNGIATNGAWQETYSGGADAYLACFNSDGDLIWATYFGADQLETGKGIAISEDGNDIFLIGATESNNTNNKVATKGAYQEEKNNKMDCFIAKFDSDGQRIWSTYYGGNGEEHPQNVFWYNDKIYLIGETNSSNVLASTGSFQESKAGDYDAFIAEFSSSGMRNWGTYFGGRGYETGQDIFINDSSQILITGETNSERNIAVKDSYSGDIAGGTDAFFALFDSNGIRVHSSYYGGNNDDSGIGIAAFSDNIYLFGITFGSNNISTAGAHQTKRGGKSDFFLTKFIIESPVPSAKPILSIPENNSEIYPEDLFFEWDDMNEVDYFLFQLSEDQIFDIILKEDSVAVNNYSPDTLVPDKNYFWRVKAFRDDLESEWSEIREFFLMPDPPDSGPELVLPANNATDLDTALFFEWQTIIGAEKYHMRISDDQIFFEDSSITSLSMSVKGLKVDTKYTWKVRAGNRGGWGPWSEEWSFGTYDPSNIPYGNDISGKISINPVPVKERGIITLETHISGIAKIRIFSIEGMPASPVFSGFLSQGRNHMEFETAGLGSGIYLLQAEIEEYLFTKIFIVSKQ